MMINGLDLSSLGFIARRRRLPGVGPAHTVVPVQGTAAGRWIGSQFSSASLSVEGWIVADSPSQARSHLDTILWACRIGSGDPLSLRFADMPDREWLGFLERGTDYSNLGKRYTSRGYEITLSFMLADARAQARDTTVLVSPGGDEGLVLGSAATEPIITVEHPGPTVVLSALSYPGGDAHRTLTWENPGTGSGDLVVDVAERTIRQGGVRAVEWMTPESVFPVLDPAEGAAFIRLIGGSSFTVEYRRRWW